MKVSGSLILVAAIASSSDSVHGYQRFLQGLPNGNAFPKALGHSAGGYSAFANVFTGKWSASLCAQNYPGSRITVGQAFGDPCCKWTPGSKPDFAVQYTPDFPAQSTSTCPTAAAPQPPAAPPQPVAPVAQPPAAPVQPAAPAPQAPIPPAPATQTQPAAPATPPTAPQHGAGIAQPIGGQTGAVPNAPATVNVVNTVGSTTTHIQQVGSAPATVTTTTNDNGWTIYLNDLITKVSAATNSQRLRG